LTPDSLAQAASTIIGQTTGPWQFLGLAVLVVGGCFLYFVKRQMDSDTEARKAKRDLEQVEQNHRMDEIEQSIQNHINSDQSVEAEMKRMGSTLTTIELDVAVIKTRLDERGHHAIS